MKILYIAGAGRSGSTLLEMILGNLPGYFSVGELLEFWYQATHDDYICGCGQLFTKCPVWSQVLKHLHTAKGINLDEVLSLKQDLDRTRFLPFLNIVKILDRKRMNQYQTAITMLYSVLNDIVGEQIIVDSSKTPAHLFFLNQVPGIEIGVLHLVRDPRAVAYSWKKRAKVDPAHKFKETKMSERSYINSAFRWNIENYMIEIFGKDSKNYTLLRYEDFCNAPVEALTSALGALNYSYRDSDLAFLKDSPIPLNPTHSVGGNPVRFSKIDSIKDVSDWKSQMSVLEKRIIDSLTFPLSGHYHYSKY